MSSPPPVSPRGPGRRAGVSPPEGVIRRQFPPSSSSERAAVLEYVREASLTYGDWTHLKWLYKQSEASAEVEVLGTLIGRLDAATSPVLEDEVLTQIAAGHTRLVFDLSALNYISSAGLQVLLNAGRSLGRRGSVVLAAPQPMVHQVLEIAGIDAMLPIYGSAAEAVNALKAS